MSQPKDPMLEDVDWDSALDEWEKGMALDVAPDADKPGPATAPPPPSDRDASKARARTSGGLGQLFGSRMTPPRPMMPRRPEPSSASLVTAPRYVEAEETTQRRSVPDLVEDEPTVARPRAPAVEALVRESDRLAALHLPDERYHDPDADTYIGPPVPREVDDSREIEITTTQVDLPDTTTEEPHLETLEAEALALDGASTDTQRALLEKAQWFESEASLQPDADAKSALLLASSELRALAGDGAGAHESAIAAREVRPDRLLALRQARWTAPDESARAEALEFEAQHLSSSEHKVHTQLLIAEAHLAQGDRRSAMQALEQTMQWAPKDTRAAWLRAALDLAEDEPLGPLAGLLEANEDWSFISQAVKTSVALREVAIDAQAEPGDLGISAWLQAARVALDSGETENAARALMRLADTSELAAPATLIAAALAKKLPSIRQEAIGWLLAAPASPAIERALAAYAIDHEHPEALDRALRADGGLSEAERIAVTVLARRDLEAVTVARLAAEAKDAVFAAALLSLHGLEPDQTSTKDEHLGRLARLLAHRAPETEIESALELTSPTGSPLVRAVALELALRRRRFDEVAPLIATFSTESEEVRSSQHLAAGLIAERAGATASAIMAYRAARRALPTNEAPLRVLMDLDPELDVISELGGIADECQTGLRGAMLRIEMIARAGDALEAPTMLELLTRAHEAYPSFPVAQFLAERMARRIGEVDDVLDWIRKRQAESDDPLERALDAVREALLVADRDPELADERLGEAHRIRPVDVALRGLYERMSSAPLADEALWREQQAGSFQGLARAVLLTEAAFLYGQEGNVAAAVRAASTSAEVVPSEFTRGLLEAAELGTDAAARWTDAWMARAKESEDAATRIEAYVRLADLDQRRGDMSSALLWHRSVLEEVPLHQESLRYVEHALLGESEREPELEAVAAGIVEALRTADGEAVAHRWLAAQLRVRAGDEAGAKAMVLPLEVSPDDAPEWALRLMTALEPNEGTASRLMALFERMEGGPERSIVMCQAAMHVRARDLVAAEELIVRASREDAGNAVAWRLLADVRLARGFALGAAEAFEACARASAEVTHQVEAWYGAALAWQSLDDTHRALVAFEQTARLDPNFCDVFTRLSNLYRLAGRYVDLAELLDARIQQTDDSAMRVALQCERAEALLLVGERHAAISVFETALLAEPDHVAALTRFAELCEQVEDWPRAEQCLVRLARLVPPDEQIAIYQRLGHVYLARIGNLSRAEVAFREVLKRAPGDVEALERLVEVHERQNDVARAAQVQDELVRQAKSPDERLDRLMRLATLYETVGRDLRRAEQVYEGARREFPTSLKLLRALAAYYTRQRQNPALHVLLDRTAADTRRALATGRFHPVLFQTLAAVSELRGRKDAARIAMATLSVFDGHAQRLAGGDVRALDPRLDDLLAPELIGGPLRSLLQRAGDALDVASAVDLRTLRPAPQTPAAGIVQRMAKAAGIASLQLFVSPTLGPGCLPLSSSPAALLVGDRFVAETNESIVAFAAFRALKLLVAHASALSRVPPSQLPLLVTAWFRAFTPQWAPQGIPVAALTEAARRVAAGLPKRLDPDMGIVALEAASALGPHLQTVGGAALAWASRTALLATGDPTAAVDALAWLSGKDVSTLEARAQFAAQAPEARDLLIFSMTDAYAEARTRLGLDR